MINFKSEKTEKLSKSVSRLSVVIPFFSLMKILRNKDVKVNGKRINKDVVLNVGDNVEIYYSPKIEQITPIFCDQNVLVVFKKSGITSEDFFVQLKQDYRDLRFIHRLDRNTSGIMIFAQNEIAELELIKGFKNRTFDKEYLAEVKGFPPQKHEVLNAFLFKDEKNSVVKIYPNFVKGSVPITTEYTVIEKKEKTSVLAVKLITGKTHQIRAHLSFIGNPIVGDGKYGDNEFNRSMKEKYQRLISNKLTLHFDQKSPLYYLDGKTFKGED